MIKRTPKYKIGDIVYYLTDVDTQPHIITGVLYRDSYFLYEISSGSDSHFSCEMELSDSLYETAKYKDGLYN